MKRKPIHPALRAVHRGVHQLHLRSYETYQPVVTRGRETEGARECVVRWEAVRRAVDEWQCRSLIDLGCSEGYYVLQAARHGLRFCVGVDFDLRRIWTGQSQVVLEDVPGAAFLVADIEPSLIEAIPTFDAVVFLSVLHHLMAARGYEAARAILQAVSRRTGKVLIFEMGQSDERSEAWAERLPDMGSAPHDWIAAFLTSCGFATVRKVAEAPSYGREVNRAVWVCEPPRTGTLL